MKLLATKSQKNTEQRMDQENLRNRLLDRLIGMPRLLNYSQIKALDEDAYQKPHIIDITRAELKQLRDPILSANEADLQQIKIELELLAQKTTYWIRFQFKPSIAPAIKAAGIILHTRLERAPLCQEA